MTVVIPEELKNLLASAESVCVLTGAGISAESGVPTFREAQTGLWVKYDPHQLATAQAFRQDPQLVWAWYEWRRSLIAAAEPNPGHRALARMEKLTPSFTLVTQNVDGLHQQAGSSRVIELHGNITRNKCFECNRVSADYAKQENLPPLCPHCRGLLRPDVVWFGENLPGDALAAAFQAARSADLFFSIGTSALVQPAASLPVEAIRNGVFCVEINPERTPISSYMNLVIKGPSGVVLPELIAATWPDR